MVVAKFVSASQHVISGHEYFRVIGYNGSVGTTMVDIAEYGDVLQIASAIAMQIDGADAADTGVVNHSGTSTGGTATTLTDTGADFTAGTPVVAGDVVINDTIMELAVVTTVTATVLTFSNSYSNGGQAGAGDAYRILDKSAGGNNAQLLEVNGLDGDYAAQSEFILTNGTGTRNLVNSYLRVNSFHVMVQGVDGNNAAGDILLEDQATGAITYNQISLGGNMSLQAYYTVPAGKIAYISEWVVGSGGNKAARVFLWGQADYHNRAYVPGVFMFQDVVTIQGTSLPILLEYALKFPPKCDIKISAIAEGIGTEISGSFGVLLVDN
jgi:CheY-specific phosphatase CheX